MFWLNLTQILAVAERLDSALDPVRYEFARNSLCKGTFRPAEKTFRMP